MAAKTPQRRIFTALDIVTSKVAALIAELTDEQKVHLLGIGVQPSRGLKKGVIVNIENTIQAIQKTVEDAEAMAGVKARDVCTSICASFSLCCVFRPPGMYLYLQARQWIPVLLRVYVVSRIRLHACALRCRG